MSSYTTAGFLAPCRLLYTTIYDVQVCYAPCPCCCSLTACPLQPSANADTLLAVDSRGCVSMFDLSCARNLQHWRQLQQASATPLTTQP